MTGVKTSKGCTTCRRRKKGCDKARPFCGQCLNAGLVCGGYSREYLWINRTSASQRGPPSIALHDSLARTARDIKYVDTYWGMYLPNGRSVSVSAMRLSTLGWTQFYQDLSRLDPTLRYATLAVSTSIIGAQNEDTQLKMKGLEAYGVAVNEMNKSLRDPVRCRGDGLLAAVRLLRIYEVLFGSNPNPNVPAKTSSSSQADGYCGHSDGETALILARGPYGAQSGPGHYLFLDSRMNSIIWACAMRKRSVFNQPQWKSIPWQRFEKSPMDRLLDVMTEIPGLLEDLDAIRANADARDTSTDAQYLGLLSRCQATLETLNHWKNQYRARVEACDYTVAGLPLPTPEEDVDFATVHVACAYWAICILLYSTMKSCDSALKESGMTEDQTDYSTEPFAHRISHAIPLLFNPHAGKYGSLVSFFPLGVAIQCLVASEGTDDAMSPERKALVGIMRRPFVGSDVGRFLRSLQRRSNQARSLEGGRESNLERARLWLYGKKMEIVQR